MAKSHCENIPLKIKQQIGNYASTDWTKPAIDCFLRIYALREVFSQENSSKCVGRKVQKTFSFISQTKGRPNLEDDEMLQKIRDVIIGWQLAEKLISRKMAVAIGAGVIKANEAKISKEEVLNSLKAGLEMFQRIWIGFLWSSNWIVLKLLPYSLSKHLNKKTPKFSITL